MRKLQPFRLRVYIAGLKQQDINLEVTADALSYLAEAGFDPVYGARPLKRTIQQKLENPLAQRY